MSAYAEHLRLVFADSEEIASWFEQEPGEPYDYNLGETRTHILAMWKAMQGAADRIERLEKAEYALACIANPDWSQMTAEDARELAQKTLEQQP